MKKIPFYFYFFTSSVFIALAGCSEQVTTKTNEQMCVEAQIKVYDQAQQGTKQREYFDTAFKSRDAYKAWAWRECMKK